MQRLTLNALAFIAVIVSVSLVTAALAQRPEVTKQDGHLSPVIAKVTNLNGTTRPAMVLGSYNRGFLRAQNESGGTVQIWLDTLSAIKESTNEEAVFVFKSGAERLLKYGDATTPLMTATPDGGTEEIAIRRVKKVEFLEPVRKDGTGKAMFDEWRFSPWTGEKLPEK